MSEFVKKTKFGYKEVEDGYSDSECTHVILTKREYDNLKEEIKEAQRKTAEVRFEADESSRASSREHSRAMIKIIEDHKKELEELNEEIADLEGELEYQQNLNKNLLRINKEKSNAERKLRPKKEHTGYAVISSQEKEIHYKSGKMTKNAVAWETVLQSPYSIEFSEEEARNQIYGELLTNEGGWKLGTIGIRSRHIANYEELIGKLGKGVYERNIAFSQRLRANYKAGYWEYIVMHTLPLEQVPKDMLP